MSKLSMGVQKSVGALGPATPLAVPPILPTTRAKASEQRLDLPDDVTEAEWEQVGLALGRMDSASNWWLGDWYATGERHGFKRLERAAEITGCGRSRISDAYRVATKVPVRTGTLSWNHHLIVAKMDHAAQRNWLAAAATGGLSVRQLRDAIREASTRDRIAKIQPGPGFTITTGDFRTAAVADAVDWIITDPPYPAEFLPLFSDLSAFAARVLKPGGSLVAMVGQSYLPEVMARLGERLAYQWTLAYLTPGGQAVQVWDRKVNTFWKPLLWYVNGEYAGGWIGDVTRSNVNDNDKRFHDWGQSESGMADIIERFTLPGELILDPFSGGHTTGIVAQALGRRYIGIEIDKDLVEVDDGAA